VKPDYDVIVVGSGASGGWAAKRLTAAGIKVALLEAGGPQSPENFTDHKPSFALPYRNRAPEIVRKTRPMQIKMEPCTEFNSDWFVNDLDEPYTTPADKPFDWIGRTRMVGGRTNVWARVSLRLSELDFTAADHDGYGPNWPLRYKDIEPYYDLVEDYVGVSGRAEGLAHLPDGHFQPPMALTCQETLMRNRAKAKLGWTLTNSRCANLTRPLHGRSSCHYCGPCERGCMTNSYFNAATTTVADALATGKCTLITNAMVSKVLTDAGTGRATGVLYVDRNTRRTTELHARVVLLCAQTQESARVLLNSAPGGLGNSSGMLGHHLTAHVRCGGADADMPTFGAEANLDRPNRPTGFYVARFRNLPGGPKAKDFIRGYGFQGDTDVHFNWGAAGFGDAYKKALKETQVRMHVLGFGEVLPRFDNFVELDPDVKDAWGIPALKIHMSNGPNELAMIRDMSASAAELLETAGATNVHAFANPADPRWATHEAGTARMGHDPKTSVLNQFQQSHDVQNLFVLDASGFPTNPCQNPTLTIMALCVRSVDHLMGEMKRGNL
jgi:choline dehydrogenase-like flavoprotein